MKTKILKPAAAMILSAFFLILSGCGATQEPLSTEAWDQMDTLINSGNLAFVAQWAQPIGSRVNQIDLTGRVNYLKMQGSDLEMQLPYFGTSQVARVGGGNQGFQFEGTASDIRISRNEKQNSYDMDFKTRDKSETLNCMLRLYTGNRAVLTINSSQRNSIRYEGELRPLN